MISAATGAMALLMITLVKEHGLQYLLAATVLTGIIQVIAGSFKVAKLMRFVSQSVVYGFLNALAILILLRKSGNAKNGCDRLSVCCDRFGNYLFISLSSENW